jgi:hypothetical protein
MLRGGCHMRDNLNHNGQKPIIKGLSIMTKDEAMIYIINFFNSRMSAVNKHNVDKVKELTTNHEIAVSELVNKYIDLVHKNS